MTCLITLFEPICSEVETKIKKALEGAITGYVVQRYLPQHWVFVTESETVTFVVDVKGNCSILNEAGDSPDVTIEIDHDYLAEALKTRKPPTLKPKKNEQNFHTLKGETAFNFIRDYLGL